MKTSITTYYNARFCQLSQDKLNQKYFFLSHLPLPMQSNQLFINFQLFKLSHHIVRNSYNAEELKLGQLIVRIVVKVL